MATADSTGSSPPTSSAPISSAGPATLAASAPPSTLQTSLDFWHTFDLNTRRAKLDQQGLDIADRQEASTASRKQLSADTRNFRRSLAEGNPISSRDVGAILRAYQAEIDSLTTRAKSAENSFISLYKALYDAPDPVDVLSQAIEDAHSVLHLRQQLSSLKDDHHHLAQRSAANSALENRLRELESQLAAADHRSAEDARALLDQKQAQWMAAQQKTIEAYELREQELVHQNRLSNDSIRRLQASSDEMQQHLNDARSQLEHLKSTRASVNDMAVEDLERTRAEANSLRRRCQQLENRLAGRSDQPDDIQTDDISASIGPSALSAELAARDVQISQLKDQVAALEEVLGGKDQEKRSEFANLTASISEKDARLSQMQQTLNQLPTVDEYENMKRQYETLQSFQLMDAESSSTATNPASEEGEGQEIASRSSETLEKRLLQKVKTLESRMTKMRVDLRDKDTKIANFGNSVRSYEDQLADQKKLISKLEDGINAITGDAAGLKSLKRRAAAASKGEGAGGPQKSDGKTDDDESAWDWGDKHQAEGLENIIQSEPSMLDIVAGQRDRFRSRTLELEEDNRKLMERVEKVTGEVDSMKNDNVRLYEKLRFVQSYRDANGGTTSDTASTAIDVGSTGAEEEGGTLIGKYRTMYEDMVNPYTIFNRRERHKRMSEMSAPERLTLRAGQRALSTKTSRLVVFCYIVALHVLVALVLSFSSSMCESDAVTTKAQHQG